MDIVIRVASKSVVDALGQYNKVPFLDSNADPAVLFIPDVEVTRAVDAEANLLVVVYVLSKEHFHLVLVIRQLFRVDSYQVGI